MMAKWTGKLTRIQAIRLIDSATDRDDPFWEGIVEDFYDEATDTMPSICDVFAALGVSEVEYREASGADGEIDWPAFACEDFEHTAELLRSPNDAIVRAAASNNLNIILAALDAMAGKK